MALEVYVDDSGNGTPPVHLSGGYLARADAWVEFVEEWQAELARDRPPAYLKIKEAASLSGQFTEWSEIERNQKLESSVAVMNRHVASSLRVSIHQDLFDRIIKHKPEKYRELLYFMLYHSHMAMDDGTKTN